MPVAVLIGLAKPCRNELFCVPVRLTAPSSSTRSPPPTKRLLLLPDSSHELTLDVDRERIMVEVYDFIRARS